MSRVRIRRRDLLIVACAYSDSDPLLSHRDTLPPPSAVPPASGLVFHPTHCPCLQLLFSDCIWMPVSRRPSTSNNGAQAKAKANHQTALPVSDFGQLF